MSKTTADELLEVIARPYARDPQYQQEWLLRFRAHIAPDANLEQGGNVHNWRNHLGCMKTFWPKLSEETRLAIFIVAEEAADNEEWE